MPKPSASRWARILPPLPGPKLNFFHVDRGVGELCFQVVLDPLIELIDNFVILYRDQNAGVILRGVDRHVIGQEEARMPGTNSRSEVGDTIKLS